MSCTGKVRAVAARPSKGPWFWSTTDRRYACNARFYKGDQSFAPGLLGRSLLLGGATSAHALTRGAHPVRRRPFLPTPATELFRLLAAHLALPGSRCLLRHLRPNEFSNYFDTVQVITISHSCSVRAQYECVQSNLDHVSSAVT